MILLKTYRTTTFFLLFFSSIFAQIADDSLSFSKNLFYKNNLFSTFDKQINIYNYRLNSSFYVQSNKLFAGLIENFNSTVVKSDIKNIKDDQSLAFLSEYNFTDLFKLGFNLNHSVHSDDRALALNKAMNFNQSLFLKFTPVEKVNVVPFLGYSSSRQLEQFDAGAFYGAEMLLDHLLLEEFDVYSVLKFQNEDILPRRNLSRFFKLSAVRFFESSFQNTITANYFDTRRDFYLPSASSEENIIAEIQNRNEKVYSIENNLSNSIPINGFSFDFSGKLSWRDIEKRSANSKGASFSSSYNNSFIGEFKVDLSTIVMYNIENFNSLFRIMISNKDESHRSLLKEDISYNQSTQISPKSNSTKMLSLTYTGNILISEKDQISLNIFHRKFIYDTPSEENFDDHDELLTNASVIYLRKFSPFFSFFVNLEGKISRLVYIFAERSANNTSKKIIKLASGGTYRSSSFVSTNSIEISANYTTYDFEYLSASYRSFSFRQLLFKDSTEAKLSARVTLSNYGFIKVSEQGNFYKERFTSLPTRFVEEIQMEPRLNLKYSNLTISTGLRIFTLRTYNYAKNEKVLLSNYSSFAPLTEIIFNYNSRLNFRLMGWYEFIENESKIRRELANMTLELKWIL